MLACDRKRKQDPACVSIRKLGLGLAQVELGVETMHHVTINRLNLDIPGSVDHHAIAALSGVPLRLLLQQC